jgi:hypothetical protein
VPRLPGRLAGEIGEKFGGYIKPVPHGPPGPGAAGGVAEEATLRVQQAKPDWLMMYITGQNHSNYYPQANAAGIKIPMGSSINIAQGYEHRRFQPPSLDRFHVTASYMEEIPTPRNRKFVQRWRAMFPDEPYMAMERP